MRYLFIAAILTLGCATPKANLEQNVAAIDAIMEGQSAPLANEIEALRDSADDKARTKGTALDVWWTWKYVMWGQGSKEEWPWN